jgi:hypothetical protein
MWITPAPCAGWLIVLLLSRCVRDIRIEEIRLAINMLQLEVPNIENQINHMGCTQQSPPQMTPRRTWISVLSHVSPQAAVSV